MPNPISLVFFRTEGGTEPVRDWLRNLPDEDRREIGLDLMRLQYRWPVGMPLARPLSKGLWELRSNLPSRRIARVIFCFHEQQLVALTGFIKKTQQTPAAEIELALARRKELST